MLVLIACLLGQFSPDKTADISAEDYLKLVETFKKKYIEERTLRYNVDMRQLRGNGRAVAAVRAKLTALKNFEKDPTQLPDWSLSLDDLKLGEVGQPIFNREGEVVHGFGQPKVAQIIDDKTLLATSKDKTFVIINAGTEKLADDDPIALNGIWMVSGKFSYTTVLGAKKTVFAISPWPHEKEYRDLLTKRAEAEAEKNKKPVPAKKK